MRRRYGLQSLVWLSAISFAHGSIHASEDVRPEFAQVVLEAGLIAEIALLDHWELENEERGCGVAYRVRIERFLGGSSSETARVVTIAFSSGRIRLQDGVRYVVFAESWASDPSPTREIPSDDAGSKTSADPCRPDYAAFFVPADQQRIFPIRSLEKFEGRWLLGQETSFLDTVLSVRLARTLEGDRIRSNYLLDDVAEAVRAVRADIGAERFDPLDPAHDRRRPSE